MAASFGGEAAGSSSGEEERWREGSWFGAAPSSPAAASGASSALASASASASAAEEGPLGRTEGSRCR